MYGACIFVYLSHHNVVHLLKYMHIDFSVSYILFCTIFITGTEQLANLTVASYFPHHLVSLKF